MPKALPAPRHLRLPDGYTDKMGALIELAEELDPWNMSAQEFTWARELIVSGLKQLAEHHG